MRFNSNLKLSREGLCMSWPTYILQGIIFLAPMWWLANDRGLDELQKSVSLFIAPMLLALQQFISRTDRKEHPGEPPKE